MLIPTMNCPAVPALFKKNMYDVNRFIWILRGKSIEGFNHREIGTQ